MFSALELFLPPTLKRKRFNSLCDPPVDLAKKHHSDLMLGHDLEYLRNYKAVFRLKIVVLVYIDLFIFYPATCDVITNAILKV